MQLLRNVKNFGASHEEMLPLWTVFCRSVLENADDLERTQKSFCKLVLKENYVSYDNALLKLNMETLKERRTNLQLKFAVSGIKHYKLNDLLPANDKSHEMKTRKYEHFKVDFANTERLKKSSIISKQTQLNEDY